MTESSVIVMKPYQQYDLNKAVIKVSATWCRACKESKEGYAKFASKYPKVKFYEADSDRFDKEHAMQKVVSKCVKKATSLPTFFFVRKGEVVGKVEGLSSSKIKKHLEEL